jgi:ADP-ribosylglycohydrolase
MRAALAARTERPALGLSPDNMRLVRACISLEGLSVGDALGGFFEGATRLPHAVAARTPPSAPWHYTDDTQMALSVVATLQRFGEIEQDALARSFAEHYERSRGYGPATRALLARIQRGANWRDESRNIFKGQGSYGNGAAMRVAPLGAFFADDLEALVEHARRSAEITHAHPEGIAGAIAVAAAAAWAWRMRGARPPTQQDFFEHILPLVPASEVASRLHQARDLRFEQPIEAIATALGNGRNVSAQDTVPFALWCAARRLDDYEAAFWLTASGLGDVDTTCAIVGGIVASYTGVEGIPDAWMAAREPLPEWPFEQG